MRLIESKSEKIVKGILIGGLIYLIGYILIFLAQSSTASSIAGHYIAVGLLLIGTLSRPIAAIIIFKFLCDALYKILKAVDKYNEYK
ncbi:hypothetical protein UT300007_11390 [Clostridium sp. CTA-7]